MKPSLESKRFGQTVRPQNTDSGPSYVIRLHTNHDSTSRDSAGSFLRHITGARWLAVALGIVLLTACGNDSSNPEDRQFANDPTKEQTQVSEAPTMTIPNVATEADTEPKASPASILKSRGAPDTVYVLNENTITSLTLADDKSIVNSWSAKENEQIVSIDDSPDGSRVAAIVVPTESSANLIVFDRTGVVIMTFADLIDLAALAATPVSDGTGGVLTPEFSLFVSWSPLGDQILVAASDGQLKAVPVAGGDPVVFESDSSLSGLKSAKWRPDGRAIGALVRSPSGNGQLLTLTVDGAALTSSTTVGAENLPSNGSVELFNWSVDGSSIFYLVTDRSSGESTGGQLFELNLAENTPELIATAGRGGPSGGIASFVPSPDGRSIAVTIAVRDGRSWTFHSLVVKSLRDGSSYDVPTSGLNHIPGVLWISEGLAWDELTRQATVFTLARPDGSEETISPDTLNGTPFPQATPAA